MCFQPLSPEWARTVALSLCGSVPTPAPTRLREAAERRKITSVLRPTPQHSACALADLRDPLWAGGKGETQIQHVFQ